MRFVRDSIFSGDLARRDAAPRREMISCLRVVTFHVGNECLIKIHTDGGRSRTDLWPEAAEETEVEALPRNR